MMWIEVTKIVCETVFRIALIWGLVQMVQLITVGRTMKIMNRQR